MTKTQCLDKIKLLICENFLLKESERLLNSGGIDYSSAENNYAVPRIILKVALRNFSDQITLVDGGEKEVKNLLCF